jgi:hypothetical protein
MVRDLREAMMSLDVVKELLGDLETVTIPGRNFTMGKVVGLLRREIGAAAPALSEPQRCAMTCALEDLGSEFARRLPDAGRFVARAQVITETLALI